MQIILISEKLGEPQNINDIIKTDKSPEVRILILKIFLTNFV